MKGFTREVISKNTLGVLMKEILEKAGLSRIYTNHQIRKTTATSLHRSGFSLEQIAHVTKHKNLDSLKLQSWKSRKTTIKVCTITATQTTSPEEIYSTNK